MLKKLTPEELYRHCDHACMDFESTADVESVQGTIGQGRAMAAMDFGLSLESKGFNIFILGESGTGKYTSIREKLQSLAKDKPVPGDWAYVYNFAEADVPKAMSFPPGQAEDFAADMKELVKSLRAEIPKVFESKEYEKSRSKIIEAFQAQQKNLFSTLDEEAKTKGFSIRKTVSGLLVVPVKPSGDPLTEDEFEALDEDHKKKIEEMGKSLQDRLDDVVRSVREGEKKIKEELASLERNAALAAVGHLIDELRMKYVGNDVVLSYLADVQEDVLAHLDEFKSTEEAPSPLPFMKPQKAEPTFQRYEVNVLVNNKDTSGAPCIFESNPTYYNLFGRLEHKYQYGMAVTDFTMIKAGALHRANGGYLVLDALDLLRSIFSYDALKRSLRNREVKIDDVWEQYRLMSTSTLKPQPIPLDVKVVIIGNPNIYYLLYSLDEEYRELFKVKADFESTMERNEESVRKYAEFIASKSREEKLLPFDKSGVARVVEHGSRLSEHQGRLSSKFSDIADLLRESHYWARKDGNGAVTRQDVERALVEKNHRHSRIEDRMQERIIEDVIIVETSGARVGQVNGLAVLDMGDHSFGKPSRITAKTFAGKAGVMNIERETKMSGKIHEKAILIINNYLASTYGFKKPMSISASITFEQLYGMIEGDSATCAELYALLSSISSVPIKQHFAVTGSMDQNGDVQPIGGVNEKLEGFFDLCAQRGLDGSHGAVIPARNIHSLMLKKEILDAVREGKFTVYAIDRMEEGLEILTGMQAGALQPDGTYPEGTINFLVMKRLDEIAEALKPKKGDKKNGDSNGNSEETTEKT